MQDPERVIDEYMFAAFLAGTLPEERRREVVEYLAVNPDAREVLHMAADALEAARSAGPEEAPSTRWGNAPATRRSDRVRHASRRSFLRGAGRYVAATAFVFVVGMVLRLAFGPPTDALRAPLQRSAELLDLNVSASGTAIEWSPVENAYRYRIVVWDPERAVVAGQYETSDSRLDQEHEVLRSLRGDLEVGRTYTIRVDAIDAQNRLIRSSETLDYLME